MRGTYLQEHNFCFLPKQDYKVPPVIFRYAINMVVRATDGADMFSEAIPVIEKALEKDESLKADSHKLHVLMANHYMIERKVDRLIAAARAGKSTWPDNKQWGFTEGVALKMAGRKKEGNAVLRDMDSAENSAEFVLELSVRKWGFLCLFFAPRLL